jgi:hypothetical protein
MQMIDVLKRLAELDAQNPSVVQEKKLNESLDECGMMGGMSQPHSPASINMTAATGEELSAMLKDIMTLAGQSTAEPEMPMGDEEPIGGADGIAVVDVEPSSEVEPSPEVGADDTSVMRSMIDKLNPTSNDDENDGDQEIDSSDDEEKVDEYDNTPDEQVAGYGAAVPSGNDLHKEKQQYPAAQPGDNAMSATYESLMAEYRKFISEDQNATEGMSDHEDELSIRSAVLDVLQTIYDGASAGEEMIDTVADELGDYYDEVEQSGDSELMKAYRFAREEGAEAEGNPEMMANVVQQAMSVLGNNQGVSEISQKLAAKAYNKMAVGDDPWKNRTGLAGDQSDRMKARMDNRWGKDATDAAIKKDQGTLEDTMESMLKLAGLKK